VGSNSHGDQYRFLSLSKTNRAWPHFAHVDYINCFEENKSMGEANNESSHGRQSSGLTAGSR
jgi:hypothetical protein